MKTHALLGACGRARARDALLIARVRGYGGEVADDDAQLGALLAAVEALDEAGIAHALIGGT